MTSQPAITTALVAFLMVAAGSAWSAPLQSDAVASAPDSGIDASARVGVPAPAAKNTVDLLIELNPRTAGLEFNERTRPPPSDGAKPPAKPEVPPQAANNAGLFGAGATPQVVSRTPAPSNTDSWKNSGTLVSNRPGASTTGDGAGPMPLWKWPREVVEFVRQHRNWVIAGAGASLVLVWAASAALARRH